MLTPPPVPTCARMVDTLQLFRKISKGASFKKDDPNAGQTFSRPVLTDTELREREKRITKALDFFGEEEEEFSLPLLVGGKRKHPLDYGLKSNKKARKVDCSQEVTEPATEDGSCSVNDSDDSERRREESDEESSMVAVGTKSVVGGAQGGVARGGIRLFSTQDKLLLSDTANADKKKSKKKKIIKKKEKDLLELKRQKANEVRLAHRISVSGDDIPDAITSFSDVKESVPPCVMKNLVKMGYDKPTPIQMQTVPLLMAGREILACAPTGSGKTAAFAIPIIAQLKAPDKTTSGVRTIIVCPTKELALQTQREFDRLCEGSGFRIRVLTGQKSTANNLGPRIDILVTTPIRLIRALSSEDRSLCVKHVEWLILDESDKLFEDGIKGFRKQIAEIYSACDHPGIKLALFSATLTTGVEQFCRVHLDSFVQITIGKVNTTADIKQQLLFVGQETGKLLAVRDVIHKGFAPPVLIFVQSVDRAKQLFHELIYDGMNVDVIHSERTQTQRDNIIKSFRAGKIWILICTDLMGRGIDFKGVNMVINYDFPPTAISYIHRIGRTGRAGRKGEAITLFTEDDAHNLRSIASVMRNSGCDIPEWMLRLNKPTKTTRKQLAKKPVTRKDIKTVAKYDLDKRRKKREMICSSQRRKQKLKNKDNNKNEY